MDFLTTVTSVRRAGIRLFFLWLLPQKLTGWTDLDDSFYIGKDKGSFMKIWLGPDYGIHAKVKELFNSAYSLKLVVFVKP